MMTPAQLIEASQRRDLTLKAFRDCIPASCSAIDPWRAWRAVLVGLAALAISEAALTFVPFGPHAPVWSWPLYLFGAFVVSCAFTGLFVVGHDCGHMAFASSAHVNVAVGHLLMSPMLTPFHNWRLAHNHHHAHTQKRGMDTDWPERVLSRVEYAAARPADRILTRIAFGSPIGVTLAS
jgi:omega-6 fatty acid desaturase (delta-12 desaturase)